MEQWLERGQGIERGFFLMGKSLNMEKMHGGERGEAEYTREKQQSLGVS